MRVSIFFDPRATTIGSLSFSGSGLFSAGNFAITALDCSSKVLPRVTTRSARASFERTSWAAVGVFVSVSGVFGAFAGGGVVESLRRSQSALIFAKKELRGLSPLSKSLSTIWRGFPVGSSGGIGSITCFHSRITGISCF